MVLDSGLYMSSDLDEDKRMLIRDSAMSLSSQFHKIPWVAVKASVHNVRS